MKKINKSFGFLTILIILIYAFSAQSQTLICDESYGTPIVGNNNVTYCRSKFAYKNYWSAEAWCQSIGGHLIDMNIDCNGAVYKETCLNLASTFDDTDWNWSNTTHSEEGKNLTVRLSNGAVASPNRAAVLPPYGYALCR